MTPQATTPAVHPARWTPAILDAIAPHIARLGLPVHDPYAGTGERLGALCDQLGITFTGTELEAPFIIDQRVRPGDSTDPTTYPDGPHVVVTSPAYPNGISDHYRAKDSSRRNTYRQRRAAITGKDQELAVTNMGRYGVRSGRRAEAKHFDLAERCVQHWPRHVIVNIKDFPVSSRKEIYPLARRWEALLTAGGYRKIEGVTVPARGNRDGANGDVRVDHEHVLVYERA